MVRIAHALSDAPEPTYPDGMFQLNVLPPGIIVVLKNEPTARPNHGLCESHAVTSAAASAYQDLANHAASLNSTRGAAFGFASIAKLAGEQLKPYVDKVVPKLYRCVCSLAPAVALFPYRQPSVAVQLHARAT